MRSILVLGLVPVLALNAYADSPPAKTPPSAANLSKMVVDLYNTSLTLESAMQSVSANVKTCLRPGASTFSAKMAQAQAGQAALRQQVYKALIDSQKAMSAQIDVISKVPALAGPAGAGTATVDAAKGMISQGIDAPSKTINDALTSAAPHIKELDDGYTGAMFVLSDSSPGCAQAKSDFTQTVYPLAHQLPKKMTAIQTALANRKTELLGWASEVKQQLVTNSGSVSTIAGAP